MQTPRLTVEFEVHLKMLDEFSSLFHANLANGQDPWSHITLYDDRLSRLGLRINFHSELSKTWRAKVARNWLSLDWNLQTPPLRTLMFS
jgi:hypothetical protein